MRLLLNKLWPRAHKWQSVRGINSNKGTTCYRGALLSNQDVCILPKISESRSPLTAHYRIILVHNFTTKEIRTMSAAEVKKAIEHLTDQFMEARELLDDARESMGTVYFSEDMNEAQNAVNKTLEQYQNLLTQLSTDQKQEVLRTIGLKMQELKAQEQSIKD